MNDTARRSNRLLPTCSSSWCYGGRKKTERTTHWREMALCPHHNVTKVSPLAEQTLVECHLLLFRALSSSSWLA